MTYLGIALWAIVGVIAWWYIVRYIEKKVNIMDIIFGLPVCMLAGPLTLIWTVYWSFEDTDLKNGIDMKSFIYGIILGIVGFYIYVYFLLSNFWG